MDHDLCQAIASHTGCNPSFVRKIIYESSEIRKLPDFLTRRLTQEILESYPLRNLEELDIHDNPLVTSVNHLQNLQILIASGENCGLSDEGLRKVTSLIYLDASENSKIGNTEHMHRLRVLRVSHKASL